MLVILSLLLKKCALVGLPVFKNIPATFDVQPGYVLGDYIAKFGPADEIALQSAKKGRNGSRSPWQLLRDAAHGDKRAAALWLEFSLAFKGRAQLFFSRGLKKLVASEQSECDPEPEPELVLIREYHGASDTWRRARRRLVSILLAVEYGDCVDTAESGPTDFELWQRLEPDGQVVEAA